MLFPRPARVLITTLPRFLMNEVFGRTHTRAHAQAGHLWRRCQTEILRV